MNVERDKLVLHADVDAFFASVEQLLIPALRGRPVIVGSGCIASCSYGAREFGLRAGMSLREAKRLCPEAVILAGDYQIYRCFAEHTWRICRRYICGLETYLDEAYGDATGMERIYGAPLELGRKLQRDVREEVGLPVSVGLGPNRMIAKIASKSAKPGGVAWIAPEQAADAVADLPIRDLPGVGSKTAARMDEMNIHTAGDLRALPREMLRALFGRRGEVLHERCRGRDPEGATSAQTGPRRPRTISRETTFHEPTCDRKWIRGMLFYLTERGMRAVRRAGLAARTLELSFRYDDWKYTAARRSLPEPTTDDEQAYELAGELLESLYRRRVALRHIGIVLSGFVVDSGQRKLFEPRERDARRNLQRSLDAIRSRYGHAAVVAGESAELLDPETGLEQTDYGFILRTPSLTK